MHGDVDRRGFLDKAQRFAKAGVTAAGLLTALSPTSLPPSKSAPTMRA